MARLQFLIRHPLCGLILILMVPGLPVFAQGLTLEHVAFMRSVGSAVLSPDGTMAAYTLSIPADPMQENRANTTHLYVHYLESGETRPFYTGGQVSSVAFRPGNRSLTFLTRQEGEPTQSLYEMPLDGGEASRLYRFDQNLISYEWAPDGKRFLFTAPEPANDVRGRLPYSPEFFEEGRRRRNAYIVDLSIQTIPRRIHIDETVYLHRWSPNGRYIAITSAPTPSIDDFYMKQQVRVVDASDGTIRSEIQNEGKIGQIEWSPNSNRLALLAGQDIHDPIDGRILIVRATGRTPRMILKEYEGKFEQIRWSDSGRIHYLASEGVYSRFGTVRPNGSSMEPITKQEGPVLLSFDRSENGSTLFTGNSSGHPTELWLLRPGESEPERLTNSNPWLNSIPMGRQEVIRYPARDGKFEIEGLFIYPVNYRPDQAIPIITVVHGGPESHYSNGWLTSYSMPGQMGAAAGYGVFYPNYRGSTGRGIEFLHSSQGDPAGKEFDDIVDGIDYLIEKGVADPDRIGVTGGSYGGYAAAWMSTYYSDRFAASVMFVGVSNTLSKWGTSDIPNELYLVHSREHLWENNWVKYLERSPIYWVDRADTPILILHGANDTRVHPSQSIELYRHLTVRRPDVPVRLVLYPGEGHGLLNATARYDYSIRMMRWFYTYLMSGDRRAAVPESIILPDDS